MIMLAIGDDIVFGSNFDNVLEIVKNARRPIDITFVRSPDMQVGIYLL
jgi:hypothetical protein